MRPLGHILLWAGFLAAAFWSVFQLELPDNKWMTIPWLWYALSMAVGMSGVVLLRAAARSDRDDHQATEAQYSAIQVSLRQLVTVVQNLCEHEGEVQPAEVIRRIDHECVEPFADFADARNSLMKRFGLQTYADVMTQFASAERYVNRAWSAAADGYIDEVSASLDRAREYLQQAEQLVQSADTAYQASTDR